MKPTKKKSGSRNDSPLGFLYTLSQKQWRKAGLVTLTACALLAWFGAENQFFIASPVICIVYWGLFLVMMAATFVIAWLDIRYIRLQYALERRNVFQETLGDEEFRKNLLNPKDPPKNNQG